MAFDIAGLLQIDERYGKDVVDKHIIALAEIMNDTVTNSGACDKDGVVFRTGGDQFIAILPGISILKARKIADDIVKKYTENMAGGTLFCEPIRERILYYDRPIPHVATIIKGINIALSKEEPVYHLDFSKEDWMDHLIQMMILRFQENLSLIRQTQNLALNDDISGLPNQRAARIFLEKALREFELYKTPFSILFIDGDNLKRYNELGYEQGNVMIKRLGELISLSVRSSDKVFRWLSGDEFLVVLTNSTLESVKPVAERIRSRVEDATKKWPFPVTISIGISNCPIHGTSVHELLSKAASANLMAKRKGKNQVICFEMGGMYRYMDDEYAFHY